MKFNLSLRMLLALVALVVFVSSLLQFKGAPWILAAALTAFIVHFVSALLLFACLYLLIKPFTTLSKLSRKHRDKGSSPFATDRLPKQQVISIDKLGN